MQESTSLKLITAVILPCLLAACSSAGGSFGPDLLGGGSDRRYNIVLIVADDLSHDHYGFAGHPVLQTPSLDALAAQSVRFPAAYGSSACRPSQATLLTGLPEHRHGINYLAGPGLSGLPTIADRLTNAGYTSFQAGKFWEGNPESKGFTRFVPFTGRTGNVSIGRTSLDPIFDFIEQAQSPWFIWFSPRMPHSPHDAPAEYTALYEDRSLDTASVDYYAMVSWFDAVVGSLLQGVPENTVVIYLADNGFVQSAWPEFQTDRSKATSYEHGIRTQLLIRHPDHPAIVRADLAQTEDVTATLLGLAKAEASDLPGQDLLVAGPVKTHAFGSRSSLKREERGLLLERWIRVDEWKLVDVEDGADRMYNLRLDPEERDNLVNDPSFAARQDDLRDKLEALWAQ